VISSGKNEGHRSGVGPILTKVAQQSLMSYNPVSDRNYMRKISNSNRYSNSLPVYAPTTDAKDEDIDAFYQYMIYNRKCTWQPRQTR